MQKNSEKIGNKFSVTTVLIVALMVLAVIPTGNLLQMAAADGSPNASASPATVNLGTADNFVILTKTGVTTTGITSIIGNIGVSPIAATSMTGFGLIMDVSNTFSKSSLVTGNIYAADYVAPTPAMLTTAISDFETAFTDAAGRTNPTATELGAGEIGGLTITPGLYKWSTVVSITSDVTLSGGENDIWIFQCATSLIISSATKVILSGGAQAKNIFWQVGTQATLGSNSIVNGNLLAGTAIVFNSGAALTGKALAKTAVTLIANSIRNSVIPTTVTTSTTTATTPPIVIIRSAVNLGSASNFVLLAKAGITTTGTTAIGGNIGVSPIAAAAMTGFGLIMHSSGEYATSSLVSGKIYAADYAAPTPSMLTTAISDFETAFTDAAGRTNPDHTELAAGTLTGVTLAPGLYKWSSVVSITGDITLTGSSSDVWIFQCATGLTVASGVHIILSGGAQASNIIWQVGTAATFGTYSVFSGLVLAGTAITFNTGATLEGRAFAKTAITLDANVVVLPTSRGITGSTSTTTADDNKIDGTPIFLTLGVFVLAVVMILQHKKRHELIQ